MRTLALVVMLAAGFCGGGPNPDPEPTPPPWAPPEAEQCHLIGAFVECWHMPPGHGWVYRCANGFDVPDPEECPVEPDPDPTPGPCMVEADLVGTTCGGAEFHDDVKKATDALGDWRGRPAREALDAVAAHLTGEGKGAIGGKEAVFILRSDGLAEENHTAAFGEGGVVAGWANSGRGKFKGCHSGVPPVVCGEPDPLGLPGQIKLKKHHRWWDSTYLVHREYEYCVEAGFVERASCPVRREGNYQREACERRVIGEQKWWCNGDPIEPRPENAAQAECIGQVKTCTEDGQTCAHAVW
jgi:hypothetical protein